MGLAAEVMAEDARPRGGGCGVAAWLADNLDDGDRAELAELFHGTVKTTAIHRVLAKRGFSMRPDALRKHRAGDCPCGRVA